MDTPPVSSSLRLKRIEPISVAKIMGILYGVMGLIFLPIALVMSIAASQMPGQEAAPLFAASVGFAIFAPVIYAVMGFLIGLLGAFLYNLVAKWVGGIELELG